MIRVLVAQCSQGGGYTVMLFAKLQVRHLVILSYRSYAKQFLKVCFLGNSWFCQKWVWVNAFSDTYLLVSKLRRIVMLQ